MSVSIDVSWKSLNKYQEELCGDKVEVLKTDTADIVILALWSLRYCLRRKKRANRF